MSTNLQNLEPNPLWKHFDKILEIPRCSGNETAIGDYIISVAEQNNLEVNRDDSGNIVVKKDATEGHENAETIILQGHIDMVCEKNSDVDHDFTKDPIQSEIKGEWVQANGTTLGADNGIGIAASLAVMEDDSLSHGPLEFLYTIDEERGLIGANKIEPGFLSGKILLNLDSEEEGTFTIGCAGGADSEIKLPFSRKDSKTGEVYRLKISGLRGGHSGTDINQGRGNAIKWLSRILWEASKKSQFEIVSIEGGNMRNAIPREAWADMCIEPTKIDSLSSVIKESFENLQFEFKAIEKESAFSFEKHENTNEAPLTNESQKTLINLLFTLPHGVISMHPEIENLVETSTNLAIVHTHKDYAQTVNSTRSSIASALEGTRHCIEASCELTGADIKQVEGYPGWVPNLESPILKKMKEIYKRDFQQEPEVGAIHAGLECGIIGEKFPGMDMISFGPTIEHPHSPEERVHIDSVDKFWKFLTTIIEEIS